MEQDDAERKTPENGSSSAMREVDFEEPLDERVNPMHSIAPDANSSSPPTTGNKRLSSTRSKPRRTAKPTVVRAETIILQVWQTFVVKCVGAEDGRKVMKG